MASGELTPKQQTSEAIRQSESILITTAQRPTVDQVAATLALSMVIRKFGKKVTTVISDQLPTGVNFLDTTIVDRELVGLRDFVIQVDATRSPVDSLRYDIDGSKLNIFLTPTSGSLSERDVRFTYGESDLDFDLAIVVGVGIRARIDRIYTKFADLFARVPVVNMDFRRSNEGYGAVNLIDPSASSLCEIVVALSESLQTGMIDPAIATVLLTGLMGATDKFTASHTSAKSLTIAAQMMALGADQQRVVRGLFGAGREGERGERAGRVTERESREAGRGNVGGGNVGRVEKVMTPKPAEIAEESVTAPKLRAHRNELRVEPPTDSILHQKDDKFVEAPVKAPVEAPAVPGTVEPVAEEVVPAFEPVAVADTLPSHMQPEVFLQPAEQAIGGAAQPAAGAIVEPGSEVTADDLAGQQPRITLETADFAAAAEVLRRHHANLNPAAAGSAETDDERPAIS